MLAKNTGAWLIVRGTTVSGTVLPATEFCDFVCARDNVSPINLQIHCNRFGTTLELHHTFSYRKGDLVIAHHSEVRVELLYLARWPSTQNKYASNTYSISTVPDHRRRSVRGVTSTNKLGET